MAIPSVDTSESFSVWIKNRQMQQSGKWFRPSKSKYTVRMKPKRPELLGWIPNSIIQPAQIEVVFSVGRLIGGVIWLEQFETDDRQLAETIAAQNNFVGD